MREKKTNALCAWTLRMVEKLYRRERHQITDNYVVEKSEEGCIGLISLHCIRFGGLSVSAVFVCVWLGEWLCTDVSGVFRALVVCRRMRPFSFSVFFFAFFPACTGLAAFFLWHKMLLKSPKRKYLERMKCIMRTNFSSFGVCIFRSRELVVHGVYAIRRRRRCHTTQINVRLRS